MRLTELPWLMLATVALAPPHAEAQGVVVDQGRFSVSIQGQSVGTEEFTIRRAGIGRDDAIFANGTVALTRDGQRQEIRPLLRATPPEGVASEYQVEVVGAEALELRLRRVASRYVAVINSGAGEEQREFPAQSSTRVLEVDVAHHYYFLRDVREGSTTSALEPRSRGRVELEAGPPTEEDMPLGQSVITARRVDFFSGDDLRTVWFDRLGRVLRVDVPARAYRATRVDVLR